ncbi:MAG: hypothetical protein ACJA0C_000753 [Candidatus Endobugula sp.]
MIHLNKITHPGLETTNINFVNLEKTSQEESLMSNKHHRLPCRGCMTNCKNYSVCNGKPWRITSDAVKKSTDHTVKNNTVEAFKS